MTATPPQNSVHPKTRAAWRAWLMKHHTRGEGVWLITYKLASGKQGLTYAEAVEEALCFGWIDSKPAKLDDERTMQWYSPRKPKSMWSAINKERIVRLIAEGKMHPAGLAKIEAAQADGSWSKLDAIDAMEMPDDLAAALAAHPPALEHFDAFPPSVKKFLLYWVTSAKRPETRAARIAETAAKAQRGERANQWRPDVRR